MAHLIDKSALVAEIEKQRSAYISEPSKYKVLSRILSLINTLEVKEVDLEKELDMMITPELKKHKALPSLFDVAKHFFELGLCATLTEEDMKLAWNIGDEIPYMAEEDFFKELLKRFKAQKGE